MNHDKSPNAAHARQPAPLNRQQLRICRDCDGTGYRPHWHGELKVEIPCRFCQATGCRRDGR